GPTAYSFQLFFESCFVKRAPEERRIFILQDPYLSLAFGSGGYQVPKSESHLGTVAHRLLRVAVGVMAWDIGFEVQAIGWRNEVMGVTAILWRIGPREFGLGQILFSVERNDVSNDQCADAQFNGAHAEEGVIIAIEDVVVIDAQPKMERITWAHAERLTRKS